MNTRDASFAAVAAALLMAAAGTAAAATPLQQCGAAQARALAALSLASGKEAARACAKGAAGAPLNIRHAAAARAVGAFDVRVGTTVDKFGEENCPISIGFRTSPDTAAFMQAFGDLGCLAP